MSEAETEDTRTTMYKELTRAKACVRLLQIHHFRNGIDLPSSCSLGIVGQRLSSLGFMLNHFMLLQINIKMVVSALEREAKRERERVLQ